MTGQPRRPRDRFHGRHNPIAAPLAKPSWGAPARTVDEVRAIGSRCLGAFVNVTIVRAAAIRHFLVNAIVRTYLTPPPSSLGMPGQIWSPDRPARKRKHIIGSAAVMIQVPVRRRRHRVW